MASGDLYVLFTNRVDNILGCQITQLQQPRVEPNSHAVIASTKDLHFTNAVDAAELIFDRQGIVAEKQVVRCSIGRTERDELQNLSRLLASRDPLLTHFLRQFGLGNGDAVLHKHRCHIEVGTQGECDRERVTAVVGTGG